MSTLNGGPGNIVTNGLVLYLDAANYQSYVSGSTTWRDLSSSNLSGSLINGPTYNSGNAGSIVFDGADDYVDCGNIAPVILSNNQFTFSCWFRMTGASRGDLFNIKNFNTPQDDVGFFIDSDNKLYAYFKVQGILTDNVNGRTSISTTVFSRNVIYNIVCMKDASQKIVMYVNGILDNNTYSTITNTSTVATTSLWIASNRTGPTTLAVPYAGNIYSTQIYNRALTASEVLQNYNATKGRFGL